MKNSEICRLYQVQNCHDCDDLSCGDNLANYGHSNENKALAEMFAQIVRGEVPPEATESTRSSDV